MNIVRREFLSLIGRSVGVLTAVAAFPSVIWAKRNELAFNSDVFAKAVSLRYPNLSIIDSDMIKLKAPSIAENGSVVPVSVKTSLAEVKSISLFIENNPLPLTASFVMAPSSVPDVSLRVRMGKTSKIYAMVESGGKLHRVQKEVKVTIGGCGG